MSNIDTYIGDELVLFKNATHWKQYYAKKIKQYIKGNVLDVGSGLGVNYEYLHNNTVESWTFVEPDTSLLSQTPNYANSKKVKGVITNLSSDAKFQTILYIDVLEHIESPKEEIEIATTLLANNGILIILCPAHQFLYSAFDKAIGHYKRYSKKDALLLQSKNLALVEANYLDSLGMLLSLSNKYLLKQQYPTANQINFWDKCIIPLSTITDWLIRYNLGKTIIMVFQKKDFEKNN